MEGGADRFGCRFDVAGGDVVHLPVGNHDNAGETLPRHVRHFPSERSEQAGPVIARTRLRLAGPNDAQIEIALASEAIAERRQRLFGGLLAIAYALARRFVDND